MLCVILYKRERGLMLECRTTWCMVDEKFWIGPAILTCVVVSLKLI
jgi:hypothetical protein